MSVELLSALQRIIQAPARPPVSLLELCIAAIPNHRSRGSRGRAVSLRQIVVHQGISPSAVMRHTNISQQRQVQVFDECPGPLDYLNCSNTMASSAVNSEL